MWVIRFLSLLLILKLSRCQHSLTYFVNTRKTPYEAQSLPLSNAKSINTSSFDPALPTVVSIHGWHQINEQFVASIRDAYLNQSQYNIITINWTAISAHTKQSEKVEKVSFTGRKIAEFIDSIMRLGYLKPDKMLIVLGHSVGAHVAGHVGKNIKLAKIYTLYGLDPSYPGFPYDLSEIRLNSSDAGYVETIQTSRYGYEKPIGTASFYPDGGKTQPGCDPNNKLCSHLEAFEIFAKAVRENGIPSIKCRNYRAARAKKCGKEFSRTVRMGALSNAGKANGVYYVPAYFYTN